MKLLLNGRDVTQEEVAKLKPDIEYLESIWRESAALERAMRKRLRLRFRNSLVANRSRLARPKLATAEVRARQDREREELSKYKHLGRAPKRPNALHTKLGGRNQALL